MHKIGIDIGTSLMKMVENNGEKIVGKLILDNKNISSNFENFIKNNKINLDNVEQICVTGVNSKKFLRDNCMQKVKIVDEFLATSKGALKLANKDKAIIASVRYRYSIY